MPQVIGQLIYYVAVAASAAYSVNSGLKARRAQKRAEREARERAARRNYRASVPERVIIHGRRNIGGPFLYLDNPTRDTFIAFIALASHECDAIERISLNEEVLNVPPGGGPVTADEYVIEYRIAGGASSDLSNRERVVSKSEWDSYPTSGIFQAFGESWTGKLLKNGSKYSGRMEIYPYLGAAGQDVGTKLTSLGATNIVSSDRFEGVCGLLVKTTKLSESFPEIQPNWNASVRGRKVMRKDGSVGWSSNPAECGRDWLENYHPSVVSPIVNEAAWLKAANHCDDLVTRKDGVQVVRYGCNGISIANEESRDVLNNFQNAMAGAISNASGEWYFQAGVWEGEEVSYGVEEVLGEVGISLQGRASDIPTHVKGKITSEGNNWTELEYPAHLVGSSGEPRVDLEVDFEMITAPEQAQRVARILGLQARREFGANLLLGHRGLLSKPGTVGRYTIPSMESAGSSLFVLEDFDRENLIQEEQAVYRCTHTIRETGEEDYFWDPATMEQDVLSGENNLSSNDSCEPSLIRFDRTDVATIPAVPDDPGTPGVDESSPEVPGETKIEVTWVEPSCKSKTLDFTRIRGIIGVEERVIDVQPGGVTAELIWSPESADPVTVSGKAFYTDGTNSGEVLGAMN